MIIVLFLLIITACLSLIKQTKLESAFFFVGIGICLLLIAIFRNPLLPDYDNYVELYNQDFNWRTEISFSIISFVVRNLSQNFYLLLFIYALIAISIKLRVIYKYSPLPFLCLLMYISHFFLLNELVQMRAGVASAFFLLAIEPLKNRNFNKFALYIFLATLFHYSSILLFLFYFIKSDRFSLNRYLFITIACLSFYLLNFNLFFFAGDILTHYDRISIYLNDSELSYSFFPLTRWICFFMVLFFVKYKNIKDQYIFILINIYFVSLCVLLLLRQIPTIGIRYSELLGVVEILLFPLLAYLVKPRFLGTISIIFYCAYIFYKTSVGILDKM